MERRPGVDTASGYSKGIIMIKILENNIINLIFAVITAFLIILGKDFLSRIAKIVNDKIFGIRAKDITQFTKRHWLLLPMLYQLFCILYFGVWFTFHIWNINKPVVPRDVVAIVLNYYNAFMSSAFLFKNIIYYFRKPKLNELEEMQLKAFKILANRIEMCMQYQLLMGKHVGFPPENKPPPEQTDDV